MCVCVYVCIYIYITHSGGLCSSHLKTHSGGPNE